LFWDGALKLSRPQTWALLERFFPLVLFFVFFFSCFYSKDASGPRVQDAHKSEARDVPLGLSKKEADCFVQDQNDAVATLLLNASEKASGTTSDKTSAGGKIHKNVGGARSIGLTTQKPTNIDKRHLGLPALLPRRAHTRDAQQVCSQKD
jgi:hypothetical protein